MNRFFGVCVLLCLWFSLTWGAGFALYEMAGRATAMGGAFTAIADDPSALYFNPAGIAFLTRPAVMAGVHFIMPQTKFTPSTPFPGGNEAESESQTFTPIHFYAAYPVMERLSLGLALFNPYGLGLKWKNPETFTGRFVSYDAALQYFDFAFSAAYRVTDCLALSGGLDMIVGSVKLNRYVELFPESPNSEVGTIELSGTSKPALGFHGGALYKKGPLGVGISYRHQVKTEFEDGDADFTVDMTSPIAGIAARNMVDQSINTEITLPSTLAFGVAYQLMPALQIGVSMNYVTWSTFDKLPMTFDSSAINTEVIENYEDVMIFRLGAEYALNDAMRLRVGYLFDQTPQIKESMSSLLGDANRQNLALGFGYRWNRMTFDVNYLVILFEERDTFKNGVGVQYDRLNGRYNSVANIFGFSMGYTF